MQSGADGELFNTPADLKDLVRDGLLGWTCTREQLIINPINAAVCCRSVSCECTLMRHEKFNITSRGACNIYSPTFGCI